MNRIVSKGDSAAGRKVKRFFSSQTRELSTGAESISVLTAKGNEDKMNKKIPLLVAPVVVALAGIGLVRSLSAKAPANVTAAPVAPVAVPAPKTNGASPTDKEIAKWQAKADANAKDKRALTNLGDALMQKGRETADASYYSLAEHSYRQAIAVDPKFVDALDGMAWIASGRHEFEQSIDWAKKAIAIEPSDNTAYGMLGDAHLEMGDTNAAYDDYQKMLDLRPDAASYSRGAHLLFVTGDVNKAVLLMAKAAQTGSPYAENTAWFRAQLALMLFNNGNLVAAQNTVEATYQQNPKNYWVLFAMGKVRAAKKDYPAAIDFYKQAVAIAPQHDALAALGDLYRLTGNKDAAAQQDALIESIHKVQKANGVRGDSQIAKFYADQNKNLPEALALAQEEYKTRKNVVVTDTLAWCEYKNGLNAAAQEHIKLALHQKTPDAAILFHAGMIALQANDKTNAQFYLMRALSLNPNFSPVYAPVAVKYYDLLGKGKLASAGVVNPTSF